MERVESSVRSAEVEPEMTGASSAPLSLMMKLVKEERRPFETERVKTSVAVSPLLRASMTDVLGV